MQPFKRTDKSVGLETIWPTPQISAQQLGVDQARNRPEPQAILAVERTALGKTLTLMTTEIKELLVFSRMFRSVPIEPYATAVERVQYHWY